MQTTVFPKPLVEKAKLVAARHKLDPVLVCAVVEQESSWRPFAVRFEKGFLDKYILPMHTQMPPTEEMCRAMSWGLMQVMGEVARELGFAGPFLSALCDPDEGLDWGCSYLVRKIARFDGNVHHALQDWNGGGNPNYADEVMARMPRYRAAT